MENNITKHKDNCRRVFKQYDKDCPRCQELMKGAKPRKGWQYDYFRRKKEEDKRRSEDIRNHDCKKAGCGVVCTYGEW